MGTAVGNREGKDDGAEPVGLSVGTKLGTRVGDVLGPTDGGVVNPQQVRAQIRLISESKHNPSCAWFVQTAKLAWSGGQIGALVGDTVAGLEVGSTVGPLVMLSQILSEISSMRARS